ncbi:MAG TPA: family 20 glycosylhydrolase [Armatimonadota bacterium]|jgi:hypothetical protein
MSRPLTKLFPPPRQVSAHPGTLPLRAQLAVTAPPGWEEALRLDLQPLGAALTGAPAGSFPLRLVAGEVPGTASDEAYALTVTPAGVDLVASGPTGARYGLRTLRRLLEGPEIACCRIVDWPVLRHRGIQIDLGRVLERPDTVERFLELYASANFNLLQFYLENAFVFPSHPQLARRFAWTQEQALEVVELAGQYGLGVIPAIQSLGHCAWVGSHPDYADLDERLAAGGEEACGVLCMTNPRTLEMLEGMINDVAPLATSGIIHLGMDESFAIGQCPSCAPRREKLGEGGLFVAHANQVAAFTRAAGRRPAIWGDMFYYYPDDLAQLDRDVLIMDWYYYVFDRYPRVEMYGFPEVDTRAMWAQYGLEAWGCPMSICPVSMPFNLPSEALENARSWRRYLLATEGQGLMVTQWELSHTSLDLCPSVEAALAGFLWGDTEAPAEELLAASCDLLYRRPELGPLLEELGEYRMHGRHALAWLRAASLAEMLTYQPTAPDLARAARLEAMAVEIAALAEGAAWGDTLESFVVAARWLAFAYRKRAYLNDCVTRLAAGDRAAAAAHLTELRTQAETLAVAWQERWDANRDPEDVAPLAEQLRCEVALYYEELQALAETEYQGQFTRPLIAVHMTNSHPSCPIMAVYSSADGQEFDKRGQVCIIEFASTAAQPTSDDRLTYTFPVDSIDQACFVKVVAVGDGQFTLRGVTLHRGTEVWAPEVVTAEGLVRDAGTLLSGGEVLMGHPDPQSLFQQLLAEGDSSRVWTLEHGWVMMEMAPRK